MMLYWIRISAVCLIPTLLTGPASGIDLRSFNTGSRINTVSCRTISEAMALSGAGARFSEESPGRTARLDVIYTLENAAEVRRQQVMKSISENGIRIWGALPRHSLK